MPIYGQSAAEGETPPILGVAQCLNKRDGKSFTAQDEQMMAALCSLFSVCLLNAQVFERERRLHRQKQALLELSSTPNPDPDPNPNPNPNPRPSPNPDRDPDPDH